MALATSKAAQPVVARRRRWKSWLKWSAIILTVLVAVGTYAARDYVRTLQSLRRVPGTNAFVMDYYVDYHLDEMRQHGMDVKHVEESCVRTLLPDFVATTTPYLKKFFVPAGIKTIGQHCSTVVMRSSDGHVYFGRNFDYYNDVFLILRIHDAQGLASIAVIDLKYVNLNRKDLDQTNLLQRFPLLFAPYYLMDGMNRHGLAVSDMAVPEAQPPYDPAKPDLIHSAMMRILLDYARTTDEAVQLVESYNVHFVETPVHLMVADATGKSCVIEFIDGKMRVTPGGNSSQICTNHLVWQKSEEDNEAACDRFRTGAAAVRSLGGKISDSDAVDVIRSMSVDGFTMWTSIYDLTDLQAQIIYRSQADAPYDDSLPRGSSGK